MSWTGYIGVLISVLGFGSNFVPLKRIKIGDGVFFQFIMCNAIFMTSIPVLIAQKFPTIHGLAFLGGFLWCTGNMLCPIAIRLIGMGMGLLVWGTISMIMGWASGTYGLFGLSKQDVANPGLNVAGVCIAIVGLMIFLQVKTNDTSVDNAQNDDQHYSNPLLSEGHYLSKDVEDTGAYATAHNLTKREDDLVSSPAAVKTGIDSWSDNTKRIVGIVLACTAGIFFGCSFDPSQYVIDNRYDGDDNSLNYVFAHFTGIIMTSWVYTIVYCIYMYKNNSEPFVSADIILPASLSGIMWGIAQIAWFYANGQLGFAITFPMISSGPGFVGSLWGIFLFKEITGQRNLAILGLAFLVTLGALLMVALSH
eukprot:gene26617-32166_t